MPDTPCQKCGHSKERHTGPDGVEDNLYGLGRLWCLVMDTFHTPPWSSCGCDGFEEPHDA